ncbi:MAG: DUF2339 domain-containing protein [Fimbriimonadales bacterium]
MKRGEDATGRRLGEIEAELGALRARMDRIEATGTRGVSAHKAVPQDDEIILDTEKAEYLIGAQWLPRIGAVLIVLAIVLSAVLGSTKGGGFDPRAILSIELIACAGFIAVGEWKRNELEGFGQVLTAIGSCGLYLAAAGAHYAYGLLGDQATTGAFVLLTLLNLLYAARRDSMAFHIIAIVGGMAGAVVPLAHHDYVSSSAAYVCVAIAGAAVCAIRNWPAIAIVQWLLTLGTLVPMIAADQGWSSLVPAFYVASFAAIAAYAKSMANVATWGLPAPFALFVTGYIGWGMRHGEIGALHLIPLSAVSAAYAFTLPRDSRLRLSLWVGAAATTAVLVPWCLSGIVTPIALAGMAVAGWLVGRVAIGRLAACFTICEMILAATAYSHAFGEGTTMVTESIVLAALGLGIACSALAVGNAGWNGAAIACAGFWVLLTKWTQVLFIQTAAGAGSFAPSTLSWVVYALLLLILGFAVRSATLRFASFVVMFATVLKILFFDLSTTSVASKMALLLLLGLMMLVSGYTYIRTRRISSTQPDAPSATVATGIESS